MKLVKVVVVLSVFVLSMCVAWLLDEVLGQRHVDRPVIRSETLPILYPCSLVVVGCAVLSGGDHDTTEPTATKYAFEAYVTAYSRESSCHFRKGDLCPMASGRDVYEGAVACPRFLKIGTHISMADQLFVCEDRYAKWLDDKRGLPTIDIFMESHEEALKFGKRKMTVYVR